MPFPATASSEQDLGLCAAEPAGSAPVEIEARALVPGDMLLIEEGERICADARLIGGTVEVDMSTLTGESVPVTRSADAADASVP